MMSPGTGENMQFGNSSGQRDFGQNMDNSGMSKTQAQVCNYAALVLIFTLCTSDEFEALYRYEL